MVPKIFCIFRKAKQEATTTHQSTACRHAIIRLPDTDTLSSSYLLYLGITFALKTIKVCEQWMLLLRIMLSCSGP